MSKAKLAVTREEAVEIIKKAIQKQEIARKLLEKKLLQKEIENKEITLGRL